MLNGDPPNLLVINFVFNANFPIISSGKILSLMSTLDKSFAEGTIQGNRLHFPKSKTWRTSVAPL